MRGYRLLAASLVLAGANTLEGQVARAPGQAVYRAKCAACHEGDGSARAPGLASLQSMSTRAIISALTQGTMRQVAADLTDADRTAVAEYLGSRSLDGGAMPKTAYCVTSTQRPASASSRDWTAWGGSSSGTGFRTAEQAGFSADQVPELELRWAFGFPGGTVTRSQPSIVGDRLLVGSQFGEIYSLDAKSGCIHWVHQAPAGIKGVIAVAPPGANGGRTAVAADFRTNVMALDFETGRKLWETRVGDHPAASITGSPAIHRNRVFVPISSMEVVAAQNPEYRCCTSSGGVVALDLATGAVVWRYRAIGDSAKEVGRTGRDRPIFGPAGVPIWSSPTVDSARGLLYLGTGENYTHPTTSSSDALQALDLATGRLVWSFQATTKDAFNMGCAVPGGENCPRPNGPDVDFGQAPLLARLENGREILIAGQKLGVVYALDPDREGAVVWQARVGRGGALGGVHWGVAAGEGRVFAPVSDRITGLDPPGERRPGLHALDLATGAPLWSQPAPTACSSRPGCYPAFSAAAVAIPGAVFAGGLDGRIRAYATADGRLIWEFDTGRSFETVNGVAATGGSIDGPSPAIGRGMLFVSAGYGLFGQTPGNVLLAFGIKQR